MSVFTKAQVREFDQNGFVIFDTKIRASKIDALISNIEAHYDKTHLAPTGGYRHGVRIQDAWRFDEEVKMLATLRVTRRALKQLFGRQPLPFQTLNFPIGTQQAPHSDTIHFNSIPSGFMAGVWIALEDIDENNGPLIYYPGSHKLPEYTMQDFGLGAGYSYYSQYEAHIGDVIKKHNLKPEFGLLKKGQAFIWHANLLHGGSVQHDKSRTRHSQVTHYYFDDCRYYTPMNSTVEALAYRTRRWIPEPKSLENLVPRLWENGKKRIKKILK